MSKLLPKAVRSFPFEIHLAWVDIKEAQGPSRHTGFLKQKHIFFSDGILLLFALRRVLEFLLDPPQVISCPPRKKIVYLAQNVS